MSTLLKTLRLTQPLSRTITHTRLPLTRTQNFSILTSIRNIARTAEAHPFERLPITQRAQKPDYARLFRHVADPAKFYFPFMIFFITWPLLGEKVVEALQ